MSPPQKSKYSTFTPTRVGSKCVYAVRHFSLACHMRASVPSFGHIRKIPRSTPVVAATSPERWSSFFLSSLTTGGQNRVGVVFTSWRLRTVGVKGATTRASSRALPRRNRRRLRKTPQRRLFLDSPTLGVRRRRSTRRWTRARRLFRSRRVRERQTLFLLLIVRLFSSLYNKKCTTRQKQKRVARDGARNKTGRKQ